MATKKAISKRYQFLRFLATIWVVDDDYEDNGVVSPWKSVTMLYISTLFERGNRDEAVWRQFSDGHHGDVEEEPEDTTHEEYQRNIRTMEEEADDEYLWGGNGKHTLFPSGVDTDEMYDPLYPSGQRLLMSNEEESSLKRKAWITSATDNGKAQKCVRAMDQS
ncbi:hypothetical protein YC2023_073309 [Brassica napus]